MYWSIDDQNSAWDHRNITIYYLYFVFDIHMIFQQWIDRFLYYYIEQLNSSLIVWWVFEKIILFCQRLKLPPIVEVN